MKPIPIIVAIVLVAAVAAGLAWRLLGSRSTVGQLELYGNVDLRQVDLAFNNSQRIAEILVQEGDRVKRGQVLARLDTSRLEPQVAEASAQVAAQHAIVSRLHNGSRPEEIAQAQANLESSKADAANARRQYERLKLLSKQSSGGAVSEQDVDNAGAALAVADARVLVSRAALDLTVAGPRKEEVAEAEARLRAQEAQLEYLKEEMADAALTAPVDATVRTRIMEPGEMASPQRPVFQLAITDPKWIRAYISEPDLGRVHPSMKATVGVDSFPDRRFDGWVGFISPVAEFTPKAVETQELRTSLVYEVRVFVKDPQNELRLGMPATVYLTVGSTEKSGPSTAEAATGREDAAVNH
jgi:membrane fusion protein PltH